MNEPLHRHDCGACEFLGQFNGADLYFCPAGNELVARRSSAYDDYTAGPAEIKFHNALLSEARRRATNLKLIKV
jgi:hypothetical protein